jgi:hypothetical protein
MNSSATFLMVRKPRLATNEDNSVGLPGSGSRWRVLRPNTMPTITVSAITAGNKNVA